MFVIAGLGNPDEKYQGTRHNVGFDVVDRLAEKYQIAVDTKKHRAYREGCGRGTEGNSCKATDLHESEWGESPQSGGILQDRSGGRASGDLR